MESGVTSLSDSNVKVSYQIYRGQIDSTDLAQYMASVDGTEFFVTLPPVRLNIIL